MTTSEQRLARIRVSPVNVHLFTQQLAVMLAAGISLTRALETLAGAQHDKRMALVTETLVRKVCEGTTFSRALSAFPAIFSPVYLAMIELGESTGALLQALEQLSDWQRRDGQTMQKVVSALTYPTIVVGLTLVMTFALFNSVLPVFIQNFSNPSELPLVTRGLLFVTRALSNPGGWLALLGLLATLLFLAQDAWSDPPKRLLVYEVLLNVPVLGGLLKSASTARMCASLAAMVSVGMGLLAGVRLAARVSGSPVFEHDSRRVVEKVKAGESLADCMQERRDLYPPTMVNLTRAGEESGRLGQGLEKVAYFYEQETEYRLEALSALIGPVVLAFVALIVGAVLVSVLLPLYGMLSKLA